MAKKRIIFMISSLFLCMTLLPQEISHETIVVNIEVPVRVFKGDKFIDDLTIDDFEVYEDGKIQRIVALYLVKKAIVERKDEQLQQKFSPETKRHFYLFFEVTEYTPKLGDAVEYFIQNVLLTGDSLSVVTPMKQYWMKSETLEKLPKEEVANQLKKILRKDVIMGNAEYKNAINELMGLTKFIAVTISGGFTSDNQASTMDSTMAYGAIYEGMELDAQLSLYSQLVYKLEHIRTAEQDKFLDFAKYLKDVDGQKYVFMFYQKEYLPVVDPKILNTYMWNYQDRPDIVQNLTSLFASNVRDISIDVDKVKKAYADASTSIHFLFVTNPHPEQTAGVQMTEHSEDIFAPFMAMAKATGGIAESSANPESLFQQAVEASENYYLLYYSPSNYKRDGKFKNIEVKVRGKNFRVIHRAGYFAN